MVYGVFSDLIDMGVLVYVDDIFIYVEIMEEYDWFMKEVLWWLKENNFIILVKKCVWVIR